jgi:hypothetical protein
MASNLSSLKNLLRAMALEPVPYRDMQMLTGVTNETLGRWMKILRGQVNNVGQRRNSLVYIAEWRKHGTITAPYWAFGVDEQDAPKPAAKTRAEHEALRVARRKNSNVFKLSSVRRVRVRKTK